MRIGPIIALGRFCDVMIGAVAKGRARPFKLPSSLLRAIVPLVAPLDPTDFNLTLLTNCASVLVVRILVPKVTSALNAS